MQRLRHATLIARLVLAAWLMALGVAIASPLVAPQSMALVCSAAGGLQLTATNAGDGNAPGKPHALDCPMCMPVAPPPAATLHFHAPAPLAHALAPIPAARIAGRTAAPLPARGPPTHA